MSDDIRSMLNELATLRLEREAARAEIEGRTKAIMAPIAEQLAEIGEELRRTMVNYDINIAPLEEDIKALGIEYGETVKGATLRAQFARGRVSWNTKGLTGYAVANPDVLAFRKQGAPYVSIRKA